jgi:hypothetical protein
MAELEENLLELYDEDISMISGISEFFLSNIIHVYKSLGGSCW